MTKEIIFKIKINQEYHIQCSYIDSQNKEIIIHVNKQEEDYYPLTISFDSNEISICNNNENENVIHFMNDWISNPDEFKLYEIHYQEKEYKMISEVLFALIIKGFKEQIEKEYIIKETNIEIPNE